MTTLVIFGRPVDFGAGRIEYHAEMPVAWSLGDVDLLKEDLLQVEYAGGDLVDVGWYPEGDPHGEWMLALVPAGDWTAAREFRTHDPDEFVAALREAVRRVGEGPLDARDR